MDWFCISRLASAGRLSYKGRDYEFIHAAVVVWVVLPFRLFKSGLPGDLDAHGFCRLRDHHASAVGGDFSVHVGAIAGGVAGWARDSGFATQHWPVRGAGLCRRGTDDRPRRVRGAEIISAGRTLPVGGGSDGFGGLFVVFRGGARGFHPALVFVHGRYVSVDDGLRAGARAGQHRKLQLPVSGERARGNERNAFHRVGAGGVVRISSHVGNCGRGKWHRGLDQRVSGLASRQSHRSRGGTERNQTVSSDHRDADRFTPGHDQMDFVFRRLQRDGDGGRVGARVCADLENHGLFLRIHRVLLPRRHVSGFVPLSA